MKTSFVRILLRLLVFTLPYTVLAVLGMVWLWQNRLALPFAVAVAIASTLAWLLVRWMESRRVAGPPEPPPSDTWPEAGEQAWARVDEIARRVEMDPPPIQDMVAWQSLGLEVLQAAAQPFHGDSQDAVAKITVPEGLKCGERILRDLRTYIEDNVPLADTIKLDAVTCALRMKQEYAGGQSWGTLVGYARSASTLGYWGTRIAISPTRAAISGAQQAAVGSGTANLMRPLMGQIAAHFVRASGRYAIDLYSGQLNLTDEVKIEAQSKPIQILLLGQTKSGKSSLVNALFGTALAKTDILPCTSTIASYAIEKPGLPGMHLFDSVGFGGEDDKQALQRLTKKLAACDLILMVCSATSAAREADRAMLDDARTQLAAASRRALPPVLVALTHVDTVRPFNEWSPPYDFANGGRPKEINVRAACAAVADDLQVQPDEVVPVCTHPDRIYNIEDGLMARLLTALPEAEQAKLLRILEETSTGADWERRKRKLIDAGVNLTAAAAAIGAAYVKGQLGTTIAGKIDSVAGLALCHSLNRES